MRRSHRRWEMTTTTEVEGEHESSASPTTDALCPDKVHEKSVYLNVVTRGSSNDRHDNPCQVLIRLLFSSTHNRSSWFRSSRSRILSVYNKDAYNWNHRWVRRTVYDTWEVSFHTARYICIFRVDLDTDTKSFLFMIVHVAMFHHVHDLLTFIHSTGL